jgi:Ca2+/Na+ antiporter
MKTIWFSLYHLVLAFWTGGIAIFTFVVTPVIFKSYPRDMAGGIVGNLFPGYFRYNLILSALAIIVFFFLSSNRSLSAYRLSLVLLAAAVIVNFFILFKLHPAMTAIKREIPSFQNKSLNSPVRNKFRRLHGLSAALNLFLLADGVTLLIAGSFLKGNGPPGSVP